MKIIDANKFFERMVARFQCCPVIGATSVCGYYDVEDLRDMISNHPPIDPETLPIVKELRAKLARYEQAEKEGRLMELPCKVGDTVWLFCKYGLCKASVNLIIQDYLGSWRIDVETYVGTLRCIRFDIKISDFGKTVFLSRKDAEAALKKTNG